MCHSERSKESRARGWLDRFQRTRTQFARTTWTWTGAVWFACAAAQAQIERPLVGPATTDEITALVKSLGDPSYETRTFATRRLCAIGPQASEALRTASEGSDTEAALRARQLLVVLDQLLFAGTEVTLAFSKQRIAWKEPVDLIVTIANRSKHAARVPFDVDPGRRGASTPDARQVTDMLDVADWLKIRAPDGRGLELRVDDLAADASVLEAVYARAAGAVGGVIPPGEKVTVELRDINRGWARYPLLNDGHYAVMLDFIPNWTDDVLLQAQAGRVVSNTAVLAITDSAPPTITRGGGPSAEIVVEADGDSFVARFLNRTDKAILINANFGSAPPFADGRWTLETNGERRDIAVAGKSATWKDFDASRLLEVDAGEFTDLARIPLRDVQKAIAADAARSAAPWTIGFSYSNLCDRAWQARPDAQLLGNQNAPPILREPLPGRLLATRLTSNRLHLPNNQ